MILKMDITNKLQDKTSNESQGNSQSWVNHNIMSYHLEPSMWLIIVFYTLWILVCVCVWVREGETDRQTDRQRQTETETDRDRDRDRDGEGEIETETDRTSSFVNKFGASVHELW